MNNEQRRLHDAVITMLVDRGKLAHDMQALISDELDAYAEELRLREGATAARSHNREQTVSEPKELLKRMQEAWTDCGYDWPSVLAAVRNWDAEHAPKPADGKPPRDVYDIAGEARPKPAEDEVDAVLRATHGGNSSTEMACNIISALDAHRAKHAKPIGWEHQLDGQWYESAFVSQWRKR